MHKVLLSICLLSLAIVGCQQEFVESAPQKPAPAVFISETEEFKAETKTSLNSNRSVVWCAGDQLAIFQGSTIADKYQVRDTDAGSTNAHFSYVKEQGTVNGDFVAGTETQIGTNIAIYPYEKNLSCAPVYEEESEAPAFYQINNVTLPSVQTYAMNSFPDEAFTMVAITTDVTDHTLKFKNLCGALKLQLKGSVTIKSIILEGNSDEILSGNGIVNVYNDGTMPSITLDNAGSKYITLDCADGVELSEDVATTFIIAVPPTDFDNGFTLTITDTEGKVAKKSTAKANPIERTVIRSMPEFDVNPSHYIRFKETSENTASFDLANFANGDLIAYIETGAKDFSVEVIGEDTSWITMADVLVLNQGTANETLALVVEYDDNLTPVDREAEIKVTVIGDEGIYATAFLQQRHTDVEDMFLYYANNETSMSDFVTHEGKHNEITLYSNVKDFVIEVPSDAASWINAAVNVQKESENPVLVLDIDSNEGDIRNAAIVLKSKYFENLYLELHITQDAPYPSSGDGEHVGENEGNGDWIELN